MEPGKLNRKVSVRARGEGQDTIGQPGETWNEIAGGGLWANIRQRTGAETLRGDKEISIVQTSIRIRRRTSVNASMRVYHGTTIYEIKAVLDDAEGREYMDLVCEVVSG